MLQLQVSNFFHNAEQGGTITSMRLIKNHYNQTSITLYKKTCFFFNGNSIQMACIVHHMWLHVMQYAHCTQIISSLITHIVLYEGLKQRKQTWNASCMLGYSRELQCIFIVWKNSTRQCVYVNRKGFTYCRHHYIVLNAQNFCMWNQWICNVCDWFRNRH